MIWNVPFNPEGMRREVVIIAYHLKEVGLVLCSTKGPMFQGYRKAGDSQLSITLVRIFYQVQLSNRGKAVSGGGYL